MVQVTSALLAIAAAAAGLAGVATETPAPTLARTLAYFKPAAAAADEAAAPPPALSKLTQAVTPAPKEVPASKEEPSAAEAYLERAKAFAVEHGKVLGGTLLALVAAVLALGGKKKAETNGSRVAAPVAPVEVTTCVEIKFRAPHAIDATPADTGTHRLQDRPVHFRWRGHLASGRPVAEHRSISRLFEGQLRGGRSSPADGPPGGSRAASRKSLPRHVTTRLPAGARRRGL